MTRPRQPRFLARQNYRRRRLIDAARLLPVVGLVLILVPILWQPAHTPEPDTARGGIYLFAVWVVLIVAALLLARVLGPDEAERPGTAEDDGEAG